MVVYIVGDSSSKGVQVDHQRQPSCNNLCHQLPGHRFDLDPGRFGDFCSTDEILNDPISDLRCQGFHLGWR